MRLFTMIWVVSLWTGCGLFESDQRHRYTVVKGDTLTRIAERHGVTVADLLQWNNLQSDQIDVGQVLEIEPAVSMVADQKQVRARRPRVRKSARKAAAKPCLKGPSFDDLDDDVPDVRSSKGLTSEQIRASLGGALSRLGKCFPDTWPDGVVDLEFTVGCNGLVSAVRVLDSGGVSDSAVACMVGDLRRVGFPAHDMPDGMIFRYPVTLSAR